MSRHPVRSWRQPSASPLRVLLGAIASVGLGVVGLRLNADAGELAGRLAGVRPEFAVQAFRAAGVAAAAAGQVAALTVVRWVYGRRGVDTALATAAAGVGVIATFAAIVLVIAG